MIDRMAEDLGCHKLFINASVHRVPDAVFFDRHRVVS